MIRRLRILGHQSLVVALERVLPCLEPVGGQGVGWQAYRVEKVAEITASGHPFIAKPFTPDALAEKVRQVLRVQPSPFARRPPTRPNP